MSAAVGSVEWRDPCGGKPVGSGGALNAGGFLLVGGNPAFINHAPQPTTHGFLPSLYTFLSSRQKLSKVCVCVYTCIPCVYAYPPLNRNSAICVEWGKKRHFLYTVRRRRKTKGNLNKWGILLERVRERERISDLEIYDVFTARIKRGAALQEWWGSFQWRVEMKWHRRAPRHAAKDPPEGEDFSFPLFIIIIIIFPTFWMGDV